MRELATLTGLLKKAASDFPDIAVSFRGGEFEFDLTDARLQELVDNAAALLAASRVGPGDVVALALPNTVEVSEFSILGSVVGCPLDRLRSGNAGAVQMKLLFDELSKTGKLEGVCYTYWEETFTSKARLVFPPLSKSQPDVLLSY